MLGVNIAGQYLLIRKIVQSLQYDSAGTTKGVEKEIIATRRRQQTEQMGKLLAQLSLCVLSRPLFTYRREAQCKQAQTLAPDQKPKFDVRQRAVYMQL